MKKIDYYLDFVKYEILDDSEKIKNYKFQLFLIYNNKPISEMNTFIKSCFDNFIKYKYIKNEFIFQIIYSVHSIGTFNINNLSKEIKAVKESNQEILNSIKIMDKEIKNLKLKLENLKKKSESFEMEEKSVKEENSKNN